MEKELINLLKEIRRHLIGITKAIEKLITSLERTSLERREEDGEEKGRN